ncbi:MAG: GSU3473 family protein [Dissulfurispiraceae bacterium]
MHIRVVYEDDTYDMVTDCMLDIMLSSERVKKFYRYSEEKWVTVGVDPIRAEKRSYTYSGPERRETIQFCAAQLTN